MRHLILLIILLSLALPGLAKNDPLYDCLKQWDQAKESQKKELASKCLSLDSDYTVLCKRNLNCFQDVKSLRAKYAADTIQQTSLINLQNQANLNTVRLLQKH